MLIMLIILSKVVVLNYKQFCNYQILFTILFIRLYFMHNFKLQKLYDKKKNTCRSREQYMGSIKNKNAESGKRNMRFPNPTLIGFPNYVTAVIHVYKLTI